jgi:hypothetical protein
MQGLVRPARSQQNVRLRPEGWPPPESGKRLDHLDGSTERTCPGQLLRRALRAEPLPALFCCLDHQVQVTVLQQEIHFSGMQTTVVAGLP